MADLSAREPCAGLGLPLTLGGCRLAALPVERITAIQPFPGKVAAVETVLRAQGLRFPAPGHSHEAGGARIVWAGRETAFLFGMAAPEGLSAHAALSDQSDGWAGLRLEGPDARAVLARLLPIDLRAGAFEPEACARAPLNHMQVLIRRAGEAAFDLFVYRSMAGTAVHELTDAMRAVAARQAAVR
ncbi:MAG: sarcosine oxidase subunit gamma [Pararhodobacter sp.]|nr:sarcosine oxidase subunit gamma [Pararhodobacter sp.]